MVRQRRWRATLHDTRAGEYARTQIAGAVGRRASPAALTFTVITIALPSRAVKRVLSRMPLRRHAATWLPRAMARCHMLRCCWRYVAAMPPRLLSCDVAAERYCRCRQRLPRCRLSCRLPRQRAAAAAIIDKRAQYAARYASAAAARRCCRFSACLLLPVRRAPFAVAFSAH